MSEHEKWFESLNENGKTVYFLGNEHKVSKMAWDFQQAEIDHLETMNQRYIGKMQEQQDQVADLKAQLNSMEQCYIEIKQEHNELIAFNTGIDRKQKVAEKTAEKYKFKVSMIADLLRDCRDQDMTLKAIKTVIDRVGEHG